MIHCAKKDEYNKLPFPCVVVLICLFGTIFMGNLSFLHAMLLWDGRTTKEKINEKYLEVHDAKSI